MSLLRTVPGRRCAEGASAVEYALLLAAIAAVLLAVVLGLASIVKDAFSSTTGCVAARGQGAPCPPASAP
jgi:pilus assembly protein Flp/PilA